MSRAGVQPEGKLACMFVLDRSLVGRFPGCLCLPSPIATSLSGLSGAPNCQLPAPSSGCHTKAFVICICNYNKQD